MSYCYEIGADYKLPHVPCAKHSGSHFSIRELKEQPIPPSRRSAINTHHMMRRTPYLPTYLPPAWTNGTRSRIKRRNQGDSEHSLHSRTYFTAVVAAYCWREKAPVSPATRSADDLESTTSDISSGHEKSEGEEEACSKPTARTCRYLCLPRALSRRA